MVSMVCAPESCTPAAPPQLTSLLPARAAVNSRRTPRPPVGNVRTRVVPAQRCQHNGVGTTCQHSVSGMVSQQWDRATGGFAIPSLSHHNSNSLSFSSQQHPPERRWQRRLMPPALLHHSLPAIAAPPQQQHLLESLWSRWGTGCRRSPGCAAQSRQQRQPVGQRVTLLSAFAMRRIVAGELFRGIDSQGPKVCG